jgi:hypothetical protein
MTHHNAARKQTESQAIQTGIHLVYSNTWPAVKLSLMQRNARETHARLETVGKKSVERKVSAKVRSRVEPAPMQPMVRVGLVAAAVAAPAMWLGHQLLLRIHGL